VTVTMPERCPAARDRSDGPNVLVEFGRSWQQQPDAPVVDSRWKSLLNRGLENPRCRARAEFE
jgi:hypothetical protein